MVKRLFFVLTSLLSFFLASTTFAEQAPTLSSDSWILVDRLTNTRLASHNENTKVNPGNSVLLMVIYTAEKLMDEKSMKVSDSIAINNDALSIPPLNASRYYLEPNKSMTVLELIKAVAIMGANDAAIALAEGLSQTVERFVDEMNKNANQLGMKNTHYTFPIGTNDKNQYTSAADTLVLTNALLNEYPSLNDIWAQKTLHNGVLQHKNSNALLWRNNSIKGIHSSDFEQKCRTSVIFYSRDFEEGGTSYSRELIGIIMGDDNLHQHTDNMMKLMSWGADNYKTLLIYPANETIERISVEGADNAKVRGGVKENLYVTLPRAAILKQGEKGFSVKLKRLDPLVSPIKEGEKLGDISVFFNGTEVAHSELIALHDVQRTTFWDRLLHRVKRFLGLH